jgi:hypothetical protein
MMLRKSVLATGVALVLCSGVSWGFGLPKMPGVPAAPAADNGGVTADAVDQFIVAGQASNAAIGAAREMLAAALSTKEERAKLISQREQLQKGLDAKDKKAQEEARAIIASQDAKLKTDLADQQKLDSLKSLSADQRKAVANSALNLGYSILLQKEQVAVGQGMISQIASNPRLATKLPAIKDTVAAMASNLSGTAGYLTSVPKLFSALGVQAKLPTSKDEKPADATANLADVFAEK